MENKSLEILNGVSLCNFCWGNYLLNEEMSIEEIEAVITRQYNIVLQEINEVLTATSKVNYLQEVIDVIFTVDWLNKLVTSAGGKLEKIDQLLLAKLSMLAQSAVSVIEVAESEFEDEILAEGLKRVIKTNMLKCNTDRATVEDWNKALDNIYQVRKQTVGEVDYYSLVDESGKIRKFKDFPVVNLEDLVS